MPESATTEKIAVHVKVNGQSYSREIEARMLLVEFLREACDLTCTHVGCDTTYCVACTVLLNNLAVKSCTMFAVQAHGCQIRAGALLGRGALPHPNRIAFSDSFRFECV